MCEIRKDETNMELLEKVLSKDNLNIAYKQVYKNKGARGVDGVTVDELVEYKGKKAMIPFEDRIDMSQMSVMTEVSDLAAVLRTAATWDFVDPDRIVLMGASLGAVVSTIVSAQPSASNCGLILLYPDLAIFDALHKKFTSLDEVPERFSYYGWFEAGRCYASDIWDYDLSHAMERCETPVMIIHGDCDDFVDLSYAREALTHFKNAELKILPGAGHIFRGKDLTAAISHIEQYLHTVI